MKFSAQLKSVTGFKRDEEVDEKCFQADRKVNATWDFQKRGFWKN